MSWYNIWNGILFDFLSFFFSVLFEPCFYRQFSNEVIFWWFLPINLKHEKKKKRSVATNIIRFISIPLSSSLIHLPIEWKINDKFSLFRILALFPVFSHELIIQHNFFFFVSSSIITQSVYVAKLHGQNCVLSSGMYVECQFNIFGTLGKCHAKDFGTPLISPFTF